MRMNHVLALLALAALLPAAAAAHAQTGFGPRIPTAYFATTGTGQSDQGIPPDPYETFSYDLALLQAGIENFNVMYYTSVLPPESFEVPLSEVAPLIHHGSVLEAIMAKAGGLKGDTVAAGVGRVWAKDKDGNVIGGFAAEYEYVYSHQSISPDQAYEDAKTQLTRSLNHELSIRGLTQTGDMVFNITSLTITKNYGMALACLGFVNFEYPGPMPVGK